MILDAPEVWPNWPGAPSRIPPIRRFVLQRFAYCIACQVHDDAVVMLAIAHAKRKPLYWIGRAG